MAFYVVYGRPPVEEPVPKPCPPPEPPKQEVVYDEKEPELVREYCSSCITPEGEIKCPRRHRCKTCHCYMTDDEWFAQKK
jgi:hypothetical protein